MKEKGKNTKKKEKRKKRNSKRIILGAIKRDNKTCT